MVTVIRVTPREREMLGLLRQGLTIKDAAARMGIGRKTADVMKMNLHRKFGVHNTVQLLVAFAAMRVLERAPDIVTEAE